MPKNKKPVTIDDLDFDFVDDEKEAKRPSHEEMAAPLPKKANVEKDSQRVKKVKDALKSSFVDDTPKPLANTIDLIRSIYKSSVDGASSAVAQAIEAYNNINENEGPHKAKEYVEELHKHLKEKETLIKERETLFKRDSAARQVLGKAPIPSIDNVMARGAPFHISSKTGRAKMAKKEAQLFRKSLRTDREAEVDGVKMQAVRVDGVEVRNPADQIIKDRFVTKQTIRIIEAAKVDMAIDMDVNNEKLNILLKKGRTLTKEEAQKAGEFTKAAKAKLPKAFQDLGIFSPHNPTNVGRDINGSSMYERVRTTRDDLIQSNMYLHKDLDNPFNQYLKSSKAGSVPALTPAQEMQYKMASDAEDRAHEQQRKKINDDLKKQNEEFYKELEEIAEKQQGMIPGRVLRIMLMANPFLGGVFTSLAVIGPILSAIQNINSLPEFVLAPIRYTLDGVGEGLEQMIDGMAGGDVVELSDIGKQTSDGIISGLEELAKVDGPKQILGLINGPIEMFNALTQNSTSEALFNSSGNTIPRALSFGLAAGALVWEADKTLELRDEKKKTEEKGKKGVKDILKDFNKTQKNRRKDAIHDFAVKNAVGMHENGHITEKLEEEIPDLIEKLDLSDKEQENLSKIFKDKFGAKDGVDLEKFLKNNISNPEIQDLLLLARNLDENGIDKLKKAFESIESFDEIMKQGGAKIDYEKTAMINELYGLGRNAKKEDLEAARAHAKPGLIKAMEDSLLPFVNEARKLKKVEHDLTADSGKVGEDNKMEMDDANVAQPGGAQLDAQQRRKQAADLDAQQRKKKEGEILSVSTTEEGKEGEILSVSTTEEGKEGEILSVSTTEGGKEGSILSVSSSKEKLPPIDRSKLTPEARAALIKAEEGLVLSAESKEEELHDPRKKAKIERDSGGRGGIV